MVGGQGLPVHADRDHRLAVVGEGVDRREADGEAVDRAADDLGRVGADAGPVEQLLEPDAGPQRVADEVAADLVADAGDRHVLLEEGQGDQLVVGELDLGSTMPVTRSRHVARLGRGTSSAVSIR